MDYISLGKDKLLSPKATELPTESHLWNMKIWLKSCFVKGTTAWRERKKISFLFLMWRVSVVHMLGDGQEDPRHFHDCDMKSR